MKRFLCVAALLNIGFVSGVSPAAPKPLINYFKSIPIINQLTTSGWGIGTSGPRDPDNGIEDIRNWRYWDGKIVKADDGKYHLFCSRWPVSKRLGAWLTDSVSVHAAADTTTLSTTTGMRAKRIISCPSTGSTTGSTRASPSIGQRISSATRTGPSIIGAIWSAQTCTWKTGT